MCWKTVYAIEWDQSSESAAVSKCLGYYTSNSKIIINYAGDTYFVVCLRNEALYLRAICKRKFNEI